MSTPPYLPNLLSSVRIALAPAVIAAASEDSEIGFAGLIVVALVTDACDGVLARRWRVATKVGRQLDHWGDVLTTLAGAIGLWLLWPEVLHDQLIWALIALVGYAMGATRRYLERDNPKARPSLVGKLAGWLVPISLLALINFGLAWPFEAAAVIHAVWNLTAVIGAQPGPEPVDGSSSIAEPVSPKQDLQQHEG